jgi:hypothetical protein
VEPGRPKHSTKPEYVNNGNFCAMWLTGRNVNEDKWGPLLDIFPMSPRYIPPAKAHGVKKPKMWLQAGLTMDITKAGLVLWLGWPGATILAIFVPCVFQACPCTSFKNDPQINLLFLLHRNVFTFFGASDSGFWSFRLK